MLITMVRVTRKVMMTTMSSGSAAPTSRPREDAAALENDCKRQMEGSAFSKKEAPEAAGSHWNRAHHFVHLPLLLGGAPDSTSSRQFLVSLLCLWMMMGRSM